jgi:tRNA A37 N6-isopentenylltransferase MiaA
MSKTPDPRFQLWVVDREKEELEGRMRVRIEEMLKSGWVEETTRLRTRFPDSKVLKAVGYQQVLHHLDHILPKGRKIREGMEGLVDEIQLAHRQLAKQQRTWFKSLGPEREFTLDQDSDSLKESLMRFYQ